jgi:hypothetical protein
MKSETQQRLLTGFFAGFALFQTIIGLFMLYGTRNSGLSLIGQLSVATLVASAIGGALCMLSFTRRTYEADMTYGVNLFALAFGPAPPDPLERRAWIAAGRVVGSWLGIAASMAALIIAETLAGHWSPV